MRAITFALRSHWGLALLMLLWIPIAMADGWAERSYSYVFLAGFFAALALIGEVMLAMLRNGARWAAMSVKILAWLHIAVAGLFAMVIFRMRDGDVLDYLLTVILMSALGAIGIVLLTGARSSLGRSTESSETSLRDG